MIRSIRSLAIVLAGGNLLLMGAWYYWLGLNESSAGSLVWSGLVALAMVIFASWLYGGAFAWWRRPDAFRAALRRLAPLTLAALAAIALYLLLARWDDATAKPAFRLGSWLTLKLQRPVKPDTVLHVFGAALWVIRWAVLPALLLPMLSGIGARGWRGFAEFGALRKQPLYWAATPALLYGALRVPLHLAAWVPYAGKYWLELVSMAARFAAGYLLFLGAWLLLAWLTSRGRPASTQLKTAPSP